MYFFITVVVIVLLIRSERYSQTSTYLDRFRCLFEETQKYQYLSIDFDALKIAGLGDGHSCETAVNFTAKFLNRSAMRSRKSDRSAALVRRCVCGAVRGTLHGAVGAGRREVGFGGWHCVL